MNLSVSNYQYESVIASAARNSEEKEIMMQKGYSVVLVEKKQLVFFPNNRIIPLTEEEYDVWENVTSYSTLIFEEGQAFIYFDADSEDNVLFITNRCNSSCIMCPTSEKERRECSIENVDFLLAVCKQIPSDTPHITITGGEPFLLKKDIFTLFNYLKTNLKEVEYLLLTNGRAFANTVYFEQFIRNKPPRIMVGIPVHGPNAAIHDYITQVPGSFEQTMMGLKRLLSRKVKVEIRIVVSKLNIGYLDEIADMIIRELAGTFTIKFIGLEMLGSARHNKDAVWMDYKSSFAYMKSSIRKLVANKFDVGIYNYPLCCVDRSFWGICEKSITDYKIRYLDECENCVQKDACGGLFQGSYRLMKGVIRAIR